MILRSINSILVKGQNNILRTCAVQRNAQFYSVVNHKGVNIIYYKKRS